MPRLLSAFWVARHVLPERVPADIFASQAVGWALEPNLKTTIVSTNGLVEIEVNTVGFRDRNYKQARRVGVRRLLVLGDSFTLALETDQAAVFHTQLENRYGGSTEVISMAASGYGPTQEYLVYQSIGRIYDPDVVLLMLYVGNDLTDHRNWPNLPRYSLESDGSLVLHNYPYTGPFDLPLVVGQRSTTLMRRSRLAFVLGTLIRNWKQNNKLVTDNCGYLIAENYPDPQSQDWDIVEALLVALRDAVEADGKEFRIAIIPTEFQVEQADEEDFVSRCQVPAWKNDVPYQVQLKKILDNNHIVYLDLWPILEEARVSTGARMYLPGNDIYWTSAGHQVVSEVLFEWLEQER